MPPITAPEGMRAVASAINADSSLGRGIALMRDRMDDFDSELEMTLTGIAVIPEARAMLDERLDTLWARNHDRRVGQGSAGQDEVIIGGGLHAAVYCAARVNAGFKPPLVLEAKDRVGGTFAVSRQPSFYLNSRNRPGPLGMPGDRRGLNVIPGASLQPANLSQNEYQVNADLAFCIRATLGQFARVVPNTLVSSVTASKTGRRYSIEIAGDKQILADRVLVSTGIGDPKQPTTEDGGNIKDDRIFTFAEFMAHMDSTFPLRGMERVAVIGGGDSGKCAVEALIGLGPCNHMSVAAIDFVKRIDWFVGSNSFPTTCEDWRGNIRSRYSAIGPYLQRSGETERGRVKPIRERGSVSPGFECAFVNEQPYDYVVWCGGYEREVMDGLLRDANGGGLYGARAVATAVQNEDVFQIGTCARLDFTEKERQLPISRFKENREAVFRLAGRTAALAATLAAPLGPTKPKKPKSKLSSAMRSLLEPTQGAISALEAMPVTVQRADPGSVPDFNAEIQGTANTYSLSTDAPPAPGISVGPAF